MTQNSNSIAEVYKARKVWSADVIAGCTLLVGSLGKCEANIR